MLSSWATSEYKFPDRKIPKFVVQNWVRPKKRRLCQNAGSFFGDGNRLFGARKWAGRPGGRSQNEIEIKIQDLI